MPDRISDRQAAAAVGQPLLMRAWSDALGGCGLHAAQVLLTADDADGRGRFINARRTLETLLAAGGPDRQRERLGQRSTRSSWAITTASARSRPAFVGRAPC
jgi:hypothetical protein